MSPGRGRAARALVLGSTLALLLAACALPPPTPEAVAKARAEAQRMALLPGGPQPGEVGYDPNPCGGDHGMLAEVTQDIRGRTRLGPPEMSICP